MEVRPRTACGDRSAVASCEPTLARRVVAGTVPLAFGTVAIVESNLFAAQGFHALIGRNILSRCIFHYNGSIGLFTLGF